MRPWPPSLHGRPQVHPEAPRFYRHGTGARLTDEDGREWLDLEMGRGPNILGYGHPHLKEALERHLRAGGYAGRA